MAVSPDKVNAFMGKAVDDIGAALSAAVGGLEAEAVAHRLPEPFPILALAVPGSGAAHAVAAEEDPAQRQHAQRGNTLQKLPPFQRSSMQTFFRVALKRRLLLLPGIRKFMPFIHVFWSSLFLLSNL